MVEEFETDLAKLQERFKAYDKKSLKPVFSNKKLLRSAIIYLLGILFGISIFCIILDIVRSLHAYYNGINLPLFIVKLYGSALIFGSLAVIIFFLEIEWRKIWKIISGSFLLFGLFSSFHFRVFDISVWLEINEAELWGNAVAVCFFILILAILLVLLVLKNRALNKEFREMSQLLNAFFKKYPEAGEA